MKRARYAEMDKEMENEKESNIYLPYASSEKRSAAERESGWDEGDYTILYYTIA